VAFKLLTILVYHLNKTISITERAQTCVNPQNPAHVSDPEMFVRPPLMPVSVAAWDAQDIERAKAAETMASADDGRERDLYELPSMLTRAGNTVEASSNVHGDHPGG
jgi:hypothetical protein